MDRLSLKKYLRQSSLIDKKINTVTKILKRKTVVGHSGLPDKNVVKTSGEFLEFFINDEPLSELLDKFYTPGKSVLDNSIGVLGLQNPKAEIIKLKQLLGKTVSEKEIRQVYPSSGTDNEIEWHLDKYNEELSNPEVLVYCCAQCGDYDCGGIAVTIDKTENSIMWTVRVNDKSIRFEFDKYQYFEILGNRLTKLQSS